MSISTSASQPHEPMRSRYSPSSNRPRTAIWFWNRQNGAGSAVPSSPSISGWTREESFLLLIPAKTACSGHRRCKFSVNPIFADSLQMATQNNQPHKSIHPLLAFFLKISRFKFSFRQDIQQHQLQEWLGGMFPSKCYRNISHSTEGSTHAGDPHISAKMSQRYSSISSWIFFPSL